MIAIISASFVLLKNSNNTANNNFANIIAITSPLWKCPSKLACQRSWWYFLSRCSNC